MSAAVEKAAAAGRPPRRAFTLVEVLVALLIVATTIATLQTVSNATLRLAVETNRLRVAKMLLRAKAEEVVAGIEQGSGGAFDGFPGYEWTVAATEVPLDTTGGAASSPGSTTPASSSGAATQPESVIAVTISVSMPSFQGSTDASSLDPSAGDPPGVIAVRTYLTPPDAKLQPPSGAGGGVPPGPGGTGS